MTVIEKALVRKYHKAGTHVGKENREEFAAKEVVMDDATRKAILEGTLQVVSNWKEEVEEDPDF